MNKPAPDGTLKTYTVVLRCSESLVRIPAGRAIRVAPMESQYGPYQLLIQQRFDEIAKFATPIPRELWIEVRGPAPNLETAVNIAAATASDYVRQLAFGANAWHGVVTVHLAYDSGADVRDREFFQNWIVDERGLPRVARDIDPDLLFTLLVAIAHLPRKDASRISRAIIQYTDALQHWKPGNEVYALAYLYMGVEAITPLVIAREVARRGLKNRKALEVQLRGPPADSLRLRFATWHFRWAGGYTPNRLDPWARREIIFRGDHSTFGAAKNASNQLEHGLAHHAEIHALAAAAVGKTAEYLREAILDLVPISEVDRQRLKAAPYKSPVNSAGYERWLLGAISADKDHEHLALEGQVHPYVRWEVNLGEYRRTEDGRHEMRLNQKIQPVIAPGVRLTINKIRFAGSTPTSHTNVELDVTHGDAPKEHVVTGAGAELAVDHPQVARWAELVGRFTLNANALPALARFWLGKLSPSLADQSQTMPVWLRAQFVAR